MYLPDEYVNILGRKFFTVRAVEVWNDLPQDAVMTKTMSELKKKP